MTKIDTSNLPTEIIEAAQEVKRQEQELHDYNRLQSWGAGEESHRPFVQYIDKRIYESLLKLHEIVMKHLPEVEKQTPTREFATCSCGRGRLWGGAVHCDVCAEEIAKRNM